MIAECHAGEDRTVTTYEALPQHVIDAVVAIEDERYWLHPGIDLHALALAMLQVLLDRDMIDRDFIAHKTIGFEELKARAAE